MYYSVQLHLLLSTKPETWVSSLNLWNPHSSFHQIQLIIKSWLSSAKYLPNPFRSLHFHYLWVGSHTQTTRITAAAFSLFSASSLAFMLQLYCRGYSSKVTFSKDPIGHIILQLKTPLWLTYQNLHHSSQSLC